MDLSSWPRSRLQELCRQHGLYAGGSQHELEDRINCALEEGNSVQVYFPAREVWRSGFVLRLLSQGKFEVMYDDNNKTCIHGLEETVFILADDDAPEGGAVSPTAAAFLVDDLGDDEADYEEEEEEEDEEFGEERFQDLPQALGMLSGTRVEVGRDTRRGRKNQTIWWPATLGKRVRGQVDWEGRQMYWLSYDSLPDYGQSSVEKVKVSFIDQGLISDRGERVWQLMTVVAPSSDEECSSEEEGLGYTGGGYGVDDITAGMSGLGFGSRAPRKRALIVGCSYRGTSGELPGKLNDAGDIYALLVQHFRLPNCQENIMLLTDDHSERMLLPTRRNILKGFAWLLADLRPGDSLFFYFSGHGGTQDDPTGQERRGNQTICPCDYSREGVITDSEIHSLLVRPLSPQTTLHSLIDSCHSGTVMNLPYNALLKRGHFHGWEEEYPGQSWQKTTAGGLAIQFSAARHDQLATEAPMRKGRQGSSAGEQRGAATFAFSNAIRHHGGIWGSEILYSDLLEKMNDELRGSNFRGQEPQMSASMQFDITRADIPLKI